LRFVEEEEREKEMMVVWKEGERTCHDGLLYLDLEAFSRTGLRLERMTLGSAEAVCHFSAGEGRVREESSNTRPQTSSDHLRGRSLLVSTTLLFGAKVTRRTDASSGVSISARAAQEVTKKRRRNVE